MSRITIFFAGAAYGLLMRLAFGIAPFLNNPDTKTRAGGPMLTSFVVLVPLLIGFYTVFAARRENLKISFVLMGPWAPTLCFVAGTAALLIEGSICIAMAVPIFCLMASLGGLLGWALARRVQAQAATLNAWSALLVLPLVAGYAETHLALPQDISQSRASTHIAAPPEEIWREINHAKGIRPQEMEGGLAYMIGVPYPLEAITHTAPDGQRVRKLRWAKDVSFDEPITAWEENRSVQWTYAFKPGSFPPGALDDHVLIGGKYFDLVDTSYRLTPEGGGTRLDIVVNYRVSTHFNWYAAWWGKVLVADSAQAILRFYKNRAERVS